MEAMNTVARARKIIFDPFGMEFRADAAALHEMLLENSPSFFEMEGDAAAFVASYRHVAQVLRDPKRFSSVKPPAAPGMQRVDYFNGMPVMNYSDAPDHIRRRKVVNPALTPKRLEFIMEHAARLIHELLQGAGSEFDVMSVLARPIARTVLLGLLMDVAEEDQHIFLDFAATFPLLDSLRLGDPKPAAYLDAWEAGRVYCRRQVELARNGKSANLLIGAIVESARGGAIDDDELMAMMMVLLSGGLATISTTIGNCLANLALHPSARMRICENSALADIHLEESLRLAPTVGVVMRFAKDGAIIDDVIIAAGTPVYVLIGVACHDPEKFPSPAMFDLDRFNVKDHLAFGYGMHTCIGNSITRLLAPLIIRIFAERYPNLAIAGRPDAIEWKLDMPRARHLKHLYLSV